MPPFIEAIAVPVISGGLLMIFKKFFEGQIEKVTHNEKTTKTVFWVSFIAIVGVAGIASFAIYHAQSDNTTTNVIEAQKTDVEAWTETGEKAISTIEDIAAESKKNREEKRAAKAKKWVYQIGDGMKNVKDAVKFYTKLLPLGNIYLFEQSNREFYLVQSNSSSEQELRDNLNAFQTQIDEIADLGGMKVEVVDLNSKCSLNEFITIGETGKMKRKKYEDVNCYICQ